MNAVLQRERSIRHPVTALPAITPSDRLRRHRTNDSGFEKVDFMGCEIIAFPLPVPCCHDPLAGTNRESTLPGSSVRETLKNLQFPRKVSKITAACCAAIRCCRREHPDLCMEEFLQELSVHMTELELDPETAGSYLSSAIAHFDDARDASPFEAALDALRENDTRVNLADNFAYLPDSLRAQYQELATLIFYLERFSGKTAFLGCIHAGRVLGFGKVAAGGRLNAMVRLGILEIAQDSEGRQAREFTLGQMAFVPPELEVNTGHRKQKTGNRNQEERYRNHQLAVGEKSPRLNLTALNPPQ